MKTPTGSLGEGGGRKELPKHYSTADLFPDLLPPITPASRPNPGTRAAEALEALMAAPQNQADYPHGWRLAAYVQDLKYRGFSILSRSIVKPGCRTEIAEYVLDRADPATAAAIERGARC